MLFHVPQPGVTWPRDVEAGVLRLQPFEETAIGASFIGWFLPLLATAIGC